MKSSNERTFVARLDASYSRYKQERMTYADSECRQMITQITQQLTQVIVHLYCFIAPVFGFISLSRVMLHLHEAYSAEVCGTWPHDDTLLL